MYTGEDIVRIGRQKIGQQYVLGARAPLDNANYNGPWDCAEFASWCAFQSYRTVFGVRPPAPRGGEAYTGYWIDDAIAQRRTIPVARALGLNGAILLRRARSGGPIGHVAISLGDGRTLEARDRARGVGEFTGAAGRVWDLACTLPGVLYAESQAATYAPPKHVLGVEDPFTVGNDVRRVQLALKAAGIDPGAIDGVFGLQTEAAVLSFQAREGLVRDGLIGADTAKVLGLPFPIKKTKITDSELAPSTAAPSANTIRYEIITSAAGANKLDYSAKTSTRECYLGRTQTYQTRTGLAQSGAQLKKIADAGIYDRSREAARIGLLAHILWPTIKAESAGYYGRINTYDRAAFTWGAYQFAAHTAGENLVLYFHELLKLTDAARYFPDLKLKRRADGKVTIHRVDASGDLDLEVEERAHGEQQIPRFMSYLNNDGTKVDKGELDGAARLMLWTIESETPRHLQIDLAVKTLKTKLSWPKPKNGAWRNDWRIVIWVNDVLHQWRGGGLRAVNAALATNSPLTELAKIGADKFEGRIDTVKNAIATLEREGVLAGWSPALLR